MNYNSNYTISAIMIFSVILFCFYYKRNIPSDQNRIFSCLIWIGLLDSSICLLGASISNYDLIIPLGVKKLIVSLYLILLCLQTMLFAYYVIVRTDKHHRFFQTSIGWLFLLPAIFALCALLHNMAVNPHYAMHMPIYSIHSEVYVLYLVCLLYMAFVTVFTLFNHDVVHQPERIFLYSCVILVLTGFLIEDRFPPFLISTLGMAICALLIFTTLQNREQVVNTITGLLNQNAFYTMVSLYINNRQPFSLYIIYINHYGYLNQTLGSQFTASLLQQVTTGLLQIPPKYSSLYYMEEGCYILLVPSSSHDHAIVHRIQELCDTGFVINQMELSLSSKICLLNYPLNVGSLESLMDHLAYLAKMPCDKQLITAEDIGFTKSHQRVLLVEKAVQRALDHDLFEVYYQPIYSVKTNQISSAEALIRLHDHVLGDISPAEFIPIAEQNGTIVPIGLIVFRKVCEFYLSNHLRERGIHYIEVNLSVAQCMQQKLTNQLLCILGEYQLDADCINLEITETAAAYSPETLKANMTALYKAGIHFSLDDYGTGYSNLLSLVDLPFHLVKLDREIVSSVKNENYRIALESSMVMFHQMNMEIVAEGIETDTQAELLIRMGCDHLQGFLFSRPLKQTDFLDYLERCINPEQQDYRYFFYESC